MFYVVDIFTKVKKLHNFSLKGKFIFSPTKQASSLNLSRETGDIGSGGLNEVVEAPGRSLASGRQEGKEDQGIIFVQSCACCSPEFCISGFEYRYLISGIGTEFQHWNPGIGTARRINLVSILWNAYRYPSPFMELEYRYWLSSTDTGCLKQLMESFEA
ncbi:hypothetical protein GQ457_10G005310 [Hibiscus cannabinus]